MSGPKPEAHKRGYYGTVLVVGVALSVVGNALHASAVTGGSTLAAAGAAIFPLLLLMMTELMMLTAKRFAGWVRYTTAGLAAVVAVISFTISYEALAYAARELFGIGDLLSWLAPLTVDLPIIAATLALWAASDLIRRDRVDSANGLAIANTGEPANGIANGIAVNGTVVANEGAADTDDGRHRISVDVANELANDIAIDGVAIATPLVRADDGGTVGANDAVGGDDDHSSTTVDGNAGDAAIEAAIVNDPIDDDIVNGEPADDVDDADIEALAVVVVDDTNTKLDVASVADALRRRIDGASYGAIAKALGVGSHTTIATVVKAAASIDPAYARAVGMLVDRPQLAAVK